MSRVRLLHTCTGHRSAIYTLAQGRDARHVRSAGGDGWVVEWNLDAPDPGRVIANAGTQIFSLCDLGPTRIVAGDMNGGMHWIDLDNPAQNRDIAHHRKGVYDLFALGPWLMSAGGDGVLTRWDAATGRAVESLQVSNQALRSIAYAPTRGELAIGASDNGIYLLDAETFALNKTVPEAHANSVFTLAFTPDGKHLLSGGRDAMLRVWDLDGDCRMLSEQPAHWYTLNHLAFSPDGALFATASRDKTIKIWDAHTFSLLKTIDTIRLGGHINSVNRLLWLPQALLSVSDDRTMKIWEIRDDDRL